jgi:membrane protein YdbS with pleckstrin-like domain
MNPDLDAVVYGKERPHQDLLKYYILRSLLLGPFFFVLLIPSFLRYRTLRYRFDDEGVSMRWGILFRREITLTYSRIQDIHLASNAVERILGLARIQVQTASGSSGAEITVEGLKDFDLIRDFLYSRMRGARSDAGGVMNAGELNVEGAASVPSPADRSGMGAHPDEVDDLSKTLHEIADEIAGLRADLAARDRTDGESR